MPLDLTGKIPANLRRQTISDHKSLAIAEIFARARNLLTLPDEGNLNVAGLGRCLSPDDTAGRGYQLDCRVPYHEPFLTEIVVPLTPGACEDPDAAKADYPLPPYLDRLTPARPSDPFLDSVRQEQIGFPDSSRWTPTATPGADMPDGGFAAAPERSAQGATFSFCRITLYAGSSTRSIPRERRFPLRPLRLRTHRRNRHPKA